MQMMSETNRLMRGKLLAVLLVVLAPFSASYAESNVKYLRKNEVSELIRIGDSYDKVVELLGKPTNDDLMMKKDQSTVVGRRLMYIYHQHDASVFNQKTDTYLRLWFGPDNLLLEMNYNEGPDNQANK